MRRRPALLLVLGSALLVVAGLVAFEVLDAHRDAGVVKPNTALGAQCDNVPDGARRITLTAADGQLLGGAVVGPDDATVGVVLRQGASQTICDWLPWAGDVADATGAKVLLFDRRGKGSSPGEGNLSAEPGDTVLAVGELRSSGATRIGLVASSMGNSAMFSALPDLSEPPCLVASISPVLTSSDSHGLVDGTALEALPRNVWVTWESQNDSIAANAASIERAAAAQGLPAPHALPVDTMDHSLKLVREHDEVPRFLDDAIASCEAP